METFLRFLFKGEGAEKTTEQRFNIIQNGLRLLAVVPLTEYPPEFARPAYWLLLLVILPPHTTRLETLWLADSQELDLSHRFLALTFNQKAASPRSARDFLRGLTRVKLRPTSAQHSEQKPLNNVHIISRPMNSVRTGLRKININYEPKTPRPFLPVPDPESSPDIIQSSLKVLHHLYLATLESQNVLKMAKKMVSLFQTFLIPGVPLCRAKCVRTPDIDTFVDKTLLVRCYFCSNKNSNFTKLKKNGFVVGERLFCLTCGSTRIESFPLVDVRVFDKTFVCNFFAVSKTLFPMQDILTPGTFSLLSPCFHSRRCYEMVDHEKRKSIVDFSDSAFFLKQKCQNCDSSSSAFSALETCLQKQAVVDPFQDLCSGCLVSALCSCDKCINDERTELLRYSIFYSLGLYTGT